MLFGKKKRRIQRILVVEDEPLVAFDAEHLLADSGFEIVATTDLVSEGLSVVNSDAPIDLVLVDVSLSDGSGIDVARAARQRGIPVIFVTGACPDGAREFALGCLAKPYPQRDLLAAIEALETLLDGKSPRKLPNSFSLFARLA
ncbi:response regulator [Sphingomonas desiccabilis]|uniref:Response regulator n=1 Tax=Sphingomonas desiccabilis TaxID=429134 RepID=A0A4Q2J017_9SPHN|nr:response regulator [Sphingomonas desiccabilis]MBB3910355.1 CheY-like chemotaxis protein [Sphingomonas desiccabilis]RXZ35013.1 response regulator [Sphingomonas desiccabilis]